MKVIVASRSLNCEGKKDRLKATERIRSFREVDGGWTKVLLKLKKEILVDGKLQQKMKYGEGNLGNLKVR